MAYTEQQMMNEAAVVPGLKVTPVRYNLILKKYRITYYNPDSKRLMSSGMYTLEQTIGFVAGFKMGLKLCNN